jgi:hypothetical protein
LLKLREDDEMKVFESPERHIAEDMAVVKSLDHPSCTDGKDDIRIPFGWINRHSIVIL